MNPLADLRDIHLPPTPGWWPPAPGWWLLAGLLLAAGVLLWRPLAAAMKRRRVRRRLCAELDSMRARAANGARLALVLGQLSTLLRRAALRRYPRQEVAGLTGEAWLAFLDRTGGGDAFRSGPGRELALGPYRARLDDHDIELDAVLAAARGWLERNS